MVRLEWTFGREIPTEDYLDGLDLSDSFSLGEAIESFVSWMEDNRFLTWEAVVREEQGLPISDSHEDVLDGLLALSDDPDEVILYIDQFARPDRPWYEILREIVPHLALETVDTCLPTDEVFFQGWPRLHRCLEEHTEGLSLPEDVSSPREIIDPDLRHRLSLQGCFDALMGLGKEDSLTLKNEEERWRVDEFLYALRAHRESVDHLKLTVESLMARVTLPAQDRQILIDVLVAKLGSSSTQEPLAPRL